MLFTSYEFIAFIVLVFILYYALPKVCQWPLLLIAGYIFYAFSDVKNLFFIAITTIVAYVAGMVMDRIRIKNTGLKKAEVKRILRFPLILCLIVIIGSLGIVKYTDFTNLLVPMGISFYTFQTAGYVIDVYRGQRAEHNFFKLALFVSYFPQLVQGPISRYGSLAKTLYTKKEYNHRNVSFGLQRILWGYLKKVVIADRIVIAVLTIIGDTDMYDGIYVFIGMMFYAVQLYADFTGGIDITIGISEVMGIKLTENFDHPYISRSVAEYWRRWHITMGTWFRDYVFYPISIHKSMLHLSKVNKRIPVYISTITVWMLTGLWHGAGWNFIVWGLLNGVILLIAYEISNARKNIHKEIPAHRKRLWIILAVCRTFLIVSSLRLLDCYQDVHIAFKMFGSIFVRPGFGRLQDNPLTSLGLSISDYVVVALGVILMCIISILGIKISVRERISKLNIVVRYAIYIALVVAILVFGVYGHNYDPTQFIYNRY